MTYLKDIKMEVIKQIEEYERGKFELSEDDLEMIMPEVIKFYNNHPEDQDVYRDKNGCILLIQTPKALYNKKGELINNLECYESNYGGDDNYLMRDCKFRIYNKVGSIGLFAEQEKWQLMGNIYDEKGFVKVPNLKLRYKLLGDDAKPMPLEKF